MENNFHRIHIVISDPNSGAIWDEQFIPIKAGGTRPMLILNCIYDGYAIEAREYGRLHFEADIDGDRIYSRIFG